MSQAIDEFWAAKKAREETIGQVETFLGAIDEIRAALSGTGTRYYSGRAWQWVNVIGGGAFPSHVADSELSINLADWPDIRKLSALFSRFHSQDHEYRQAWVRLSQDEKEQLQAHAPEEMRPPTRY